MALFNQLLDAQKQFQLQLLAKAGVVGVAVGYRDVKGQPTDELVLVALVEQKKPKDMLTPEDLVPEEIQGAKTDVMEIGIVRAQNISPRDKWRPMLPGGISIGHYKVTAGTLGVMVKDRTTGDRLILSNNHVLANSNDAFIGDPIIQPGAVDKGQLPADIVGRLERFVPLRYVGDPVTPPIITSPPVPTQPPTPKPTQPPAPTPTQPPLPFDPTQPPTGGTNPTPTPTQPPAPTPNPTQPPDTGTPPVTPPTSNTSCDIANVVANVGNALAKWNGSDKRLVVQSVREQATVPLNNPAAATTLAQQTTVAENRMDCALARPVNAAMFSDEIRNIGRIIGIKPPQLGMKVRKTGRTTDTTRGTITLLNATIDVGYNTLKGPRTARFTGQIICTGMSQGGDSGSLIVEDGSQYAVGLLFAGSGTATIFTPIDRVLAQLNVTF
jgi:hypothetical protein